MLKKVTKSLRYLVYFPIQPWFIIKIGFLLGLKKGKIKIIPPNVNRILVIKLDEIGDTILAIPFFRELRSNYPNAEITVILKPVNYDLLAKCPYFDRILKFETRFNKFCRVFQQYRRMFDICIKDLWRTSFDVCIIPRWDADDLISVPMAYFSMSKLIVAYDQNDGTEKLIDLKIPKNINQHEVLQNLEILRELGGEVYSTHLEYWHDESDMNYALDVIKNYRSDSQKRLIAIALGARDPSRIWDINKFACLVDRINTHYANQFIFILLGSSNETHLAKEFAKFSHTFVIDQLGSSLRHTAGILKYCSCFIGNNSGLAHLAAAVGTPTVTIFSHPKSGIASFYNSPQRFSPWQNKNICIQPENSLPPCTDGCSYKFAHCINQITIESVIEAFENLSSRQIKPNELVNN